MVLFTVVPVSRIKSIAKYGLMPNNMLTHISSEYDRVFYESEYGYFYASTTLKNSCDWSRFIAPHTNEDCIILTYEIEDEFVERDLCSPNQYHCDVRIFNKIVEPSKILAISVIIYDNGCVDFGSLKKSLDLTQYSNIDTFIDEYKIKRELWSNCNIMSNINKYGKNDIYICSVPRGLELAKERGKFSWSLVSILNLTIDDALEIFERYGHYIFATYYYENALGLYNILINLQGEATLLKASVHGSQISINNIGINKRYSDIKISGDIAWGNISVIKSTEQPS